MQWFEPNHSHKLNKLERIAVTLLAVLTILTFAGTNLQALLWQSSDWLVGTVLPAVVVDLTNDQRGGYDAVPLRRNLTLDAAATAKAEHMAQNGYFSHFAPDGTSPWFFFEQAGYTYAHAGENLAVHFTDSAEVVEAWMKSPAHKDNIVNGDYREIGVGTAKGLLDGHETVFVVQLFGTPAVTTAVPTPQQIVTAETVVTEQIAPEESEAQSVTETPSAQELAEIRASLEALEIAANRLEAAQAQEAEAQAVQTQESVTVAADPVVLSQANSVPEPITQEDPAVFEVEAVSFVQEDTADFSPVVVKENVQLVPKFPVRDILVVETQLATSSGLAVASISENIIETRSAGATVAAAATRPNLVLDVIYSAIIGIILLLLCISLVGETRRLHYVQAAYSLALLAGVGGLWAAHMILTGGAAIL